MRYRAIEMTTVIIIEREFEYFDRRVSFGKHMLLGRLTLSQSHDVLARCLSTDVGTTIDRRPTVYRL